MEQIWNNVLQFSAQFVTPDWGALIGLIPFAILGLILLFVLWLVRSMTQLGPTRRGPGRVQPAPPPGVHAPGPSFAPIFGAVGVALVMFGLVWGGVIIALGAVALLLALLYWGREAMREYDHVAGSASSLPAVIHAGPPPGVHMPGPSFRPLLAALSVAVMFYGLVFGGWLLASGFIMLIVSLVGWLRDARVEYAFAEQADSTGHLQAAPAPRVPVSTLVAFGVLFVVAVILTTGIIPPKTPAAAGGAGASGGPAASGATGGPAADQAISAQNIAYDKTTLTATAGKAFTLAFTNNDAGIPHNVDIRLGSASGKEVFKGDIFNGPATKVYNVPALQAGTYTFMCSVHNSMTGTLTVK